MLDAGKFGIRNSEFGMPPTQMADTGCRAKEISDFGFRIFHPATRQPERMCEWALNAESVSDFSLKSILAAALSDKAAARIDNGAQARS